VTDHAISLLDTLPAPLSRALAARGYATLTPVQEAVLAPEAKDRDLLVSARTGSGKTVAYGLAIAPDLLLGADAFEPAGAPLALIIAPTRELALQVREELDWLYKDAGARVVSCVGGMDPRREQRALAAGVHIVVGTPGRLRDHIERGNLTMAEIRAVVLDEADEMLDLGFREELEEILDTTPPTKRALLFSATLPPTITAMAKRYQQDALRMEVGGKEESHGDIAYQAVRIAPSDVENATVNLLRFHEAGAAIVFCSTREAVKRLHANLVERGFPVVALSGELSQAERSHALQALRDRRARVCVATDVAARGIDIPQLELVIHADLPHDAEVLQHRSGRTGRAGRKGISAILVPHPKRRRAEMLLRGAKVDVEWVTAPTADEIRAKDQARFIESIAPAAEAPEEDQPLIAALLAERSAEDIAAALVKLNRSRLPSPEELVDAGPDLGGFAPARERGAPRAGFEDTVWFRVDIGRNKNADPRWLLPLICRRGHLTKSDIGAIRIFDRETRFEIPRAVEARFREAIAATEGDGVNIVASEEATPLPPRKRFDPRKGRPNGPPGGPGGFGTGGPRGAGPRPAGFRPSGPRPAQAGDYRPWEGAADTRERPAKPPRPKDAPTAPRAKPSGAPKPFRPGGKPKRPKP
jgi:ATP-dependent RNA helicase DeaD